MTLPLLALTLIQVLHTDSPTSPGRFSFVSAASGLVLTGSEFWIAPDDELHLARFSRDPKALGKWVQVVPGGPLPEMKKARKKVKPDFESLVVLPSGPGEPALLLALPSGSTASRVGGAWVGLGKNGSTTGAWQAAHFGTLFTELRKKYAELNVEGAVATGSRLKLFQRGNGSAGHNAVIDLDLKEVVRDLRAGKPVSTTSVRSHQSRDLGLLGTTRLGFTDAALGPSGDIFFLAAAEDKNSTYADGEFRGAVLGRIDVKGKLSLIVRLDVKTKPEGLWMDANGKDFFVVTDADDAARPAELLRGRLP